MADDARGLSEPQIRSILLEYRFGVDSRNIGDICDKYGLARKEFQRLRKKHGHQFATEEEMVIAGVHGGAHTITDLIGYLDYRDHAVYRELEVREFLDNLVGIRVLVEKAGGWHFAPGAPASDNRYVFTAPEGAAHETRHFGDLRHPNRR